MMFSKPYLNDARSQHVARNTMEIGAAHAAFDLRAVRHSFVSSSLWYEAADRNVTEQKLFSA
jgi:hypothetical protein